MRRKPICEGGCRPATGKISISAIALRVYKSSRDAWITEFGQPYLRQFGAKEQAMTEARKLAARYRLRVLSEVRP